MKLDKTFFLEILDSSCQNDILIGEAKFIADLILIPVIKIEVCLTSNNQELIAITANVTLLNLIIVNSQHQIDTLSV